MRVYVCVCVTAKEQNVLSRSLAKLSMLLHGVCGWEEHEDGLNVGGGFC